MRGFFLKQYAPPAEADEVMDQYVQLHGRATAGYLLREARPRPGSPRPYVTLKREGSVSFRRPKGALPANFQWYRVAIEFLKRSEKWAVEESFEKNQIVHRIYWKGRPS